MASCSQAIGMQTSGFLRATQNVEKNENEEISSRLD